MSLITHSVTINKAEASVTNICLLNIGNMKRKIRRELKNQVKVPKSPSPPFPIYCLCYSVKWLLPASLGMTLGPTNGICYLHSHKKQESLLLSIWRWKEKEHFICVSTCRHTCSCSSKMLWDPHKKLGPSNLSTEAPDMENTFQMLGGLGLCFYYYYYYYLVRFRSDSLFTTIQLLLCLPKRKLKGIQNILQTKTRFKTRFTIAFLESFNIN